MFSSATANKCDRECSSGRRRRRSSEAWRTKQRVVLDGHWTGVGRRLDRRRRLPQRPARRVRVAAARHRRRLRLGAHGCPAATSPDPGDRRARALQCCCRHRVLVLQKQSRSYISARLSIHYLVAQDQVQVTVVVARSLLKFLHCASRPMSVPYCGIVRL